MSDVATIARERASHCEAKKHALRQTQDGIVVAFVLHPNDVPPALQLAPLGTRYLLALVEIGDDETPIDRKEGDAADRTHNRTPEKAPAIRDPDVSRARKPFNEMLYAQQAGMLSNDPRFWLFMSEKFGGTIDNKDEARATILTYCDVQSRSDIRPQTTAGTRWELLLSGFQAWKIAPACGVA